MDTSNMILIITNKKDLTADMVVLALQERGIPYARFNTEDFPQHVQLNWELSSQGIGGTLGLPRGDINLADIKSVWFRRPVTPVIADSILDPGIAAFARRESQEALSGIWRTLDCFWISHPHAISLASYKARQLILARSIGFSVPRTLISNSAATAEQFRLACGGKIVAKPLRSGVVEIQGSVKVIYTTRIEQENLELNTSIEIAPVLFQEYIEKETEIRITIIGSSIFGAEFDSQSSSSGKDDWRRVEPGALKTCPLHLPKNLSKKCLQIVSQFGLNFAAIDMIKMPNGDYVFLELNPNGQWGWLEHATEEPYTDAMVRNLVAGHPV